MNYIVDDAQRRAARIVGFTYLLAMAAAVFAEEFARGQLIVPNDAAQTARNIIEHERYFRLGIASYLLCMATDVVLITGLYVVLERVNRNLALFAVLARMVETVIGVVATLNSFDVLRLLSGAEYLSAIPAEQLQALARVSVSLYSSGINVSFVFLGIGSTVFGYLWYKSGYIPKPLALLGLVGSVILGAAAFLVIIVPDLGRFMMAFMALIGVFEVAMGFLLLVKPIPIGRPA